MNGRTLRTMLLIGSVILYYTQSRSQDFLHAEGRNIINGEGTEVILRGMGLGGWMLQEGYMLETSAFANTQHEIRAAIQELIGPENTDTFYNAWLSNHVQKIDIDSLAAWGFNSVRLPMHYNLFTPQELPVGEYISKGFDLIDSLLSWCADNEVYLILDLHAAPGGQGDDAGICDYDPSQPSLWESEENKARTADLWKTLAARYADEKWIGGYDLINEPKWDDLLTNNNADLWNLLIRITDSIRTVDENHMIIIEGNIWANNYTGFPDPWDDNMVISFHKYWNPNTTGAIQWVLDMRNQYNIPVWLGETGENSNTWFVELIELMEQHKIGYAFWPEKKINSVVGPATVIKTSEYQQLLDYWGSPSTHPRPDTVFAKSTLMEIADRLKLENCRINRDVTDAFSRQINNTATMPYASNIIPGKIYAVDYDMGRQGYAYYDTDYQNISSNQYNKGGKYRNDGVDIEQSIDPLNGIGYNVGWTAPGEWLKYTVQVDSTAGYDLIVRYAGPNNSTRIRVLADSIDVTGQIAIPSTSAWNVWNSITIEDIILTEGMHSLVLRFDESACNLSYIEFENPKPVAEIDFKALYAATDSAGTLVMLTLNKECDPMAAINSNDFILYINNEIADVNDITIDTRSGRILKFGINKTIHFNDVLTLSYSGTSVATSDGQPLESFQDLVVVNNMPSRYELPCKIEAEEYYRQSGLDSETTTDTGGGLNMGWTDTGDYLEYLVYISEAGMYGVNFRVASQSQSGTIQLQLIDENTTVTTLGSYTLPVTGGWQSWQTKSANVSLPSGYYTLRLNVITAGFNLNWLSFSEPSGITYKNSPEMMLFPNPCMGEIFICTNKMVEENSSFQIADALGTIIIKQHINAEEKNCCRIDTSSLKTGLYVLSLQQGNSSSSALFSVIK